MFGIFFLFNELVQWYLRLSEHKEDNENNQDFRTKMQKFEEPLKSLQKQDKAIMNKQ